MIQNGQTELKKPVSCFFRLPEGVRWYVERQSLFVAKIHFCGLDFFNIPVYFAKLSIIIPSPATDSPEIHLTVNFSSKKIAHIKEDKIRQLP